MPRYLLPGRADLLQYHDDGEAELDDLVGNWWSQDIDMADQGHEQPPDAGSDSGEDSCAVYSDSDEENKSPPGSPHRPVSAEIYQGPLIFSPADRHIQQASKADDWQP